MTSKQSAAKTRAARRRALLGADTACVQREKSKAKEQLKVPRDPRHKPAIRQFEATTQDPGALLDALPKPVNVSEDVLAIHQSPNLDPKVQQKFIPINQKIALIDFLV
ncbi:hypothetical protein PI125_g24060 [Phytophthora idaei]|nr:hypothetical protein PI125_g24060 [Phytophthora idaei]